MTLEGWTRVYETDTHEVWVHRDGSVLRPYAHPRNLRRYCGDDSTFFFWCCGPFVVCCPIDLRKRGTAGGAPTSTAAYVEWRGSDAPEPQSMMGSE